jgi:hypothetical protein
MYTKIFRNRFFRKNRRGEANNSGVDVSQAPVAESQAQNPQEDSSASSKWSERGRIILSTVKKTLNVAEKMLDGFPIPGVKGAVAVVRDIVLMVEVRYTISIVVNFNHISNLPIESR